MKEEIWKDIPDWEGIYQVSNLGRVKSCERQVKSGSGYRMVRERILKAGLTNAGYLTVFLFKNNKRTAFYIHQLVAIAFLGHKPNGYNLVVNHKNENKTDNRLQNLEITTNRENLEYSYGKFSSKHRGILWHKRCKKWQANYYCSITKKQHHIGLYDTEEQAYFARESWISDYREYRERIESSWF